MKKFKNTATAVLVLIFISAFLLLTVFRKTGNESYQENRILSSVPELSPSSLSDGSYTERLGSCFTDHFAGRSYWISVKAELEANIGESMVNGVYIADNMLLGISDNKDISWEECAAIVNDFADSYDGAVYFVAVPTSSGVYGDVLPEYLTYNTEKQQIDTLYSMFSENIRKIDAYNILKMLNGNYIYYRNDSKWTSYGAYCVYRTVIQKLGFLPVAYDKYTIEHISGEFRGDLYNKSQYTKIKADMIDIYTYNDGAKVISCTGYNNDGTSFEKTLYDKSYIDTNDMYRLYLGEDAPLVRIKTDVNNDRKLLVIKDGYADCFIPFLIQHYSEIAVITPECVNEGISGLIRKEDYAQTLFLFGIDGLYDYTRLGAVNK